ncbi:uncharacterized protein LACBIDRAFT_334558 [Laccaria bicolor S238N-H82]|uniref:Predicted protein n=1 Tax=Laccaria bicolor (strain S238N-H82 / ATCC MYA-4686) TaxID=486041 RepID=B0DZN1_LACBS|nr:uncharacterized protein LACBIDRAFT_334558 [Laccaria bicolor S238N-H82]EDQ99971.1 predicted protein [Laccaria bicolor S238N-H82]|eukprot:XP_001889382.1 predicted protein [Laccaria bicolor S238N-H82]
MSSHNHNPMGKNQHATVPSVDDPRLAEVLTKFHREGLSSNSRIKQRLFAEYGISASVSSIKRWRNDLQLLGPRSKLQKLTEKEKEQVVLQQLDRDPSKGQGLGTIKNHIAHDQGIQLARDTISGIMHLHDADAFLAREPGAKRIHRVPKAPIGVHERWSGDGHDKLYKIGFPIWAVVDDATARWLAARVVPSNRMGDIIGYLFLCLVLKYKGLPLQFSTDCGSETTQLYGLVNALRQIFHPDYDIGTLPAHCYLRSVHNISIERSWLRLRLDFGDNAVTEYQKGPPSGNFKPEDPVHSQLSQWLWSKTLQLALDGFTEMRNGQKMRKDNEKAGPSGCSRNEAFFLPQNFGLVDKLLPLNDDQLKIVFEIKEFMGGDALLAFASPEFSEKAEIAYQSLGVTELTIHNAWHIFEALLPLFYILPPVLHQLITINLGSGLVAEGSALQHLSLCSSQWLSVHTVVLTFHFWLTRTMKQGFGVVNALCGYLESQSPKSQPSMTNHKKAPHIPTTILRIQGVTPLLLEQNATDMGGTFRQGYQAQASDPRLNKPSTAHGVEGGLNKLKNLSKAQTVVAERKAKREEANLVGTGIKVGATLWKIPEQGKMTKIEPIRVVHVFSPETETKDALGTLLGMVRKPFVDQYPDADMLTCKNTRRLNTSIKGFLWNSFTMNLSRGN